MNTRSLRFRLAAWHAVLFAAAFAVLSTLLYVSVKKYLDDTLLETQGRRARQIAETLLANANRTERPTSSARSRPSIPRTERPIYQGSQGRTAASSTSAAPPTTKASIR